MSRLFWVRSETFDHGVFNTSVRWTVTKVLDFVTTIRHGVAPKNILGRSTWVDITTTRCKPTLSEAEAAAYWHVFTVLQQSILGQFGEWLDIRLIGIVLMCQVFSPHRVRTDQFAKSTEMWPGHERNVVNVSSPRHSPRGSSPRVAVSAQTTIGRGRDSSGAMLAFVRQHLGDFLQLTGFALKAETNFSNEEFDVLGLVLGAGTSLTHPFAKISEAVPELVSKKTMPVKELRKYVEKNLVWNDEVYGTGESLVSPDVVLMKTVNITGINKTTWFQRSAKAEVEFLNIVSCNDCAIYITSPARFCLITGCHDCTIIMCGVSILCTIQNCEKISVHVAAHCFKMENSIDSSAFLFCHLPPVLTGDTRGIKLAPFNVLYSQMSNVLQSTNMKLDSEFVDTWAHPVCCTLGSPDETLGGRSGGALDDSNHTTYHFVRPADFQPVVIPEAEQRPLASPSLCLPQAYNDALKTREEEMHDFHRQFAQITDEGKRKRAQQAIQGQFREWLQATGKGRQLADLARLSQQGK